MGSGDEGSNFKWIAYDENGDPIEVMTVKRATTRSEIFLEDPMNSRWDGSQWVPIVNTPGNDYWGEGILVGLSGAFNQQNKRSWRIALESVGCIVPEQPHNAKNLKYLVIGNAPSERDIRHARDVGATIIAEPDLARAFEERKFPVKSHVPDAELYRMLGAQAAIIFGFTDESYGVW